MKKLLIALLALSLLVTAVGCSARDTSKPTDDDSDTDKQTSSSVYAEFENTDTGEQTSPTQTPLPTEDENKQELTEQLFETMLQAVRDGDEEAFAACFVNGTDIATIKSNYDILSSMLAEYDQVISNYVFDIDEDSFGANILFAITTGTHPNTHSKWSGGQFLFVRTNDGWKTSFDNNVLTKAQTAVNKAYPVGMQAAIDSGRNTLLFETALWLHLTPDTAIKGAIITNARLMWQDEHDNLHLCLHINNGTDTNRSIYNIRLEIVDQTHGTIFSGAVDNTFMLKAMSNDLVEITIPADKVATGKKAWTSVSIDIKNSNQ